MEKLKFTFSPDKEEALSDGRIVLSDADSDLSAGETVEFFVLEETRINGVNYILAAESENEDSEVWIFKDISDAKDKDAIYVVIEDEEELNVVAQVFSEELGDDATIQI